ncbi:MULTISPECIES: hypothetical protein [unclassified Modestobacter]|uniref:hypothetical protein n=1 Tax=unclassified Modestobacter TaxID=2643866 RepID=UPI0022A9FAB7|nr:MULTISPECIES: hypothetical protein [unclassified Modestobacter]MCZ2811633.1 hypothetical protein [Modestobacter sp. VKM Ac-2979]MCZ2843356.1 hypothetical protein [Modestobacter sp. VKM Ac-2980]MCZ2848679.1 hypothetical protein [Modestobacter sp. VKM Ac-2978]
MADTPDSGHSDEPGLRQQIANGGWQLYALEFVALLVVFGWLFVTVYFGGGEGPW